MEGGALNAYKFLRPGSVGPFSRRPWRPGEWYEGIYACEVRHLPLWIWEELWEVEMEGDVTTRGHKLHAPRGRLVRRVDAWSMTSARDFARESARRAAGHAAGPLRDAGHPEAADVFARGDDLDAIRALTSDLWDDLAPDVQRPVGMAGDGAVRASAAVSTDDAYVAAQGGAVSAYIAAMTAFRVGGRAAYDAERAHQGDWLGRALGLV